MSCQHVWKQNATERTCIYCGEHQTWHPRQHDPWRALGWVLLILVLLFATGIAKCQATVKPEFKPESAQVQR